MTEARVSELVQQAFDYRGYVTLRRRDGSELVGFVYDRGASHPELFDETATRRVKIPLAEIADIAFTGEDAAEKSQEIWERRKGRLEPRETSFTAVPLVIAARSSGASRAAADASAAAALFSSARCLCQLPSAIARAAMAIMATVGKSAGRKRCVARNDLTREEPARMAICL